MEIKEMSEEDMSGKTWRCIQPEGGCTNAFKCEVKADELFKPCGCILFGNRFNAEWKEVDK